MKIYHINETIVQANLNKDEFEWENNTNNASIFEIDEITPENKNICIDLIRTIRKLDINGLNKYYMFNNASIMELHVRDNWIPIPEPEI